MPENKKIALPTQLDLDLFVSIQAHDLRTPFNHVTGFSKMLLNTLGEAALTDIQKEDLTTVYRSGMRALTLMNGLIDIARIHRLEKDLNPKETDIEQMLTQAIAHWKKFNPGGDVEVGYHILCQAKSIHADEQLNRQVISSFIAFIGLYCEAKATITITVSEEPNWFLVTFVSTGTKARVPSELDRQMIGYINRALVEMQKGQIRQADETDTGAIVQFSLPKKS